MRFALLGDHPDGLGIMRALVTSGRHELAYYVGPETGREQFQIGGLVVPRVGDPEEVLADPAVDGVVVASSLSVRPIHLRRGLQSERHVLCAYPPDVSPDIAYEAAMLSEDTGRVLLPLLPWALHPGLVRLREILSSPVGAWNLIEIRRSRRSSTPDATSVLDRPLLFPDWDVLRSLGGDVAEVWAYAESEETPFSGPVVVAGRFERGGLFQVTQLPDASSNAWTLAAHGSGFQVQLTFPYGLAGCSRFCGRQGAADCVTTEWEPWDPWPALVVQFESAVAVTRPATSHNPVEPDSVTPTWQLAVRCLELEDAAWRSLRHRRASVMDYQEANEETTFKGTMTLVGCGMLWAIIVLAILSRWWPGLGWLVVPALAAFLGMQFLRWFIRSAPNGRPS